MRCHFDVVRRVVFDQDGVEVVDPACAVAEARRAIVELRLDAHGSMGQAAAPQVEFGADLFLLVRTDCAKVICVIPLDDRLTDH